MAGDHLVQPGVQVLSVLLQCSIPAASRSQNWAAVIQHPETAAFRCEGKLRKVSETRLSVLPWTLSDQDCHTRLGLEKKRQGLGTCPGEGPGRNPTHLGRNSCWPPVSFRAEAWIFTDSTCKFYE